jgi:lipoic acid synthetase
MVGLGETFDELTTVFQDIADANVDILTVGQYLQPTSEHLPIDRYWHPTEFAALREAALAMGFRHVEAGPLVRSSYHAEEQVQLADGHTAGPRRPASNETLLDVHTLWRRE